VSTTEELLDEKQRLLSRKPRIRIRKSWQSLRRQAAVARSV
jgi:hypothetical protein